MRTLYPSIEPYAVHQLKVSNLHTIYVEECGNPEGQPAVFLHGGPGGGIQPEHRQFFDPHHYRIILVDQRGCGKSVPHAELRENTTWDLVEDLEVVRKHLNVASWLVFGGSWGSTLALAYATRYPSVISHLVLRGIFLCRKKEIDWFYQDGASWIFPESFKKYSDFIPENERHDFVTAYYKALTSTDESHRLQAAVIWSQWEAQCSKLYVDPQFVEEYEDPHKALAFARIECHYFINHAFFETDNYLIEQAHSYKHIPTHIVQGRYDIVCPAKSAFELKTALPDAQLEIIDDAGHSAFEKGILSALVCATDRFRS